MRSRSVSGDPVADYVLLGLRTDRLLPGSMDVFPGDCHLADIVRGEAVPTPSVLVRDAGRLAAGLPGDLGPDRERFLRGQLLALEWTARRLAGQAVPYASEVAAAFQTVVEPGSQDAYRAAHRELELLLPGPGALAERLAAHRRHSEIPRGRLGVALRVLSEALRERTIALVPLPAGESVGYRIVEVAPWSALHRYLGGFRSQVTVNAGARPGRAQLVRLVAHEVYPGHHTERCRKEDGIVARGGDEHRIVLANTPQSLVAEGSAELGLQVVVGPGWGRFAADVLAEVGLGFDGELAERVDAVTSRLARVRQDAALLLHERRLPPDEVLAHLRRWMLVGESRARHVLGFLRHPVWRSYTTTYVEGLELVRGWWELEPGLDRFLRLLDEPLTPAALRAETGAAARPDGRQANVSGGTPTATGGGWKATSGTPLR